MVECCDRCCPLHALNVLVVVVVVVFATTHTSATAMRRRTCAAAPPSPLLLLLLVLVRHHHRYHRGGGGGGGGGALALMPTPALLREHDAGTGIHVHDWGAIGRADINRPIRTTDPAGMCCGTNYTTLWDTDGEIIAFAVDNFFCPSLRRRIRAEALGGRRGDAPWETFAQALNRVHRDGESSGEEFYMGNYPGITRYPVHYHALMSLRRCVGPFMESVMLDSEMYQLMLSKLPEDIRDVKVVNEHDGAWPGEVQMERLFGKGVATRNGEGGGDDEEDEDDEEGDAEYEVFSDGVADASVNADGAAAFSTRAHFNPLHPKLHHMFWASAALPPENITSSHSNSHTDGLSPGFASVYVATPVPEELTDDRERAYFARFRATGTAFTRSRDSRFAILTDEGINRAYQDHFETLMRDAAARGEARVAGWLNESVSRFSEVLAVAHSQPNRFIMYPSNRLHTAWVPDANLLVDDPRWGRLTMNTFWGPLDNRRYHAEFCQDALLGADPGSHYTSGLDEHGGLATMTPGTPRAVQGMCRRCEEWGHLCGWCPTRHSCVDLRQWDAQCPESRDGFLKRRKHIRSKARARLDHVRSGKQWGTYQQQKQDAAAHAAAERPEPPVHVPGSFPAPPRWEVTESTAICKHYAAKAASGCLRHLTCDACTAKDERSGSDGSGGSVGDGGSGGSGASERCVWCPHKGICADSAGSCNNKTSAVRASQGLDSCPHTLRRHDCTQHSGCNTCVKHGCAYNYVKNECLADDPRFYTRAEHTVGRHALKMERLLDGGSAHPSSSPRREGGARPGDVSMCDPSFRDKPPTWENSEDQAQWCFRQLSCRDCLAQAGCSWCAEPGGGFCGVEENQSCRNDEAHVKRPQHSRGPGGGGPPHNGQPPPEQQHQQHQQHQQPQPQPQQKQQPPGTSAALTTGAGPAEDQNRRMCEDGPEFFHKYYSRNRRLGLPAPDKVTSRRTYRHGSSATASGAEWWQQQQQQQQQNPAVPASSWGRQEVILQWGEKG